MERRGPDLHFQAQVEGPFDAVGHETVARVLKDWASERPSWREALPWVAWTPTSEPSQ